MPRRDRLRPPVREAFPGAAPLEVAIPLSTGSARLRRETDGSVLLEVNGVPSSHLHPDPEHLVFEYMRWMALVIDEQLSESSGEVAPGAAPHPALAHLGGGGCSLPRTVIARHPHTRHTVVEIDALLAEQVRGWFSLPRAPRLRIRVQDARSALEEWRSDRFEVVVRDVFSGDSTPAALTSRAAARQVDRVLRPGGIYLANCAAMPGSGGLADEVATLASVFPVVGVIAEPAHLTNARRGNAVLLASHRPLPGGIGRRLRSDAVSVRLASPAQVESLRSAGRVLDPDADPTP